MNYQIMFIFRVSSVLQGAVCRLFRVDNSIEFAVLGLNAPVHVSFHIFNRIISINHASGG